MARKSVKKTGPKAGRAVGPLIPQPHGGAIRPGRPLHPVAGTGRPPDEVRAKMRELGASKGLPFLSDLLDGKVSVSLLGKCDACGHDQPMSVELMEQWMERVKASTDHRLKATEQAFKYGLQAKELVITSGNAGTFFDCVHAAIVEQFGETAGETVKVRALALMEAST